MEKVGGGGFFQALSKLRGRDKFINCSINFLCKLNIFYTDTGQYKRCLIIQQKKVMNSPQFFDPNNLIMY